MSGERKREAKGERDEKGKGKREKREKEGKKGEKGGKGKKERKAGADVAARATEDAPFGGPAPRPLTDAELAEVARVAQAVDARLSGHRLEHVHGVARTARALAGRYGVDPYLAEVAGLLHDWDKKLSAEELWSKVAACGIDLHGFEAGDARLLPLLHGWTAAASLPAEFGELPDEVFRAIERHTVGDLDMSPLDMVVFVADMLEPGRTGDGVERLRGLARTETLPGLFAACVRGSIAYVLETGRFLYPGAVDVWNAYCAELPDSERPVWCRRNV